MIANAKRLPHMAIAETYQAIGTVYVLTARPHSYGIGKAIRRWCEANGLRVHKVIGCASLWRKGKRIRTAEKKGRVLAALARKYDHVSFYDDCPDNIAAARNAGVHAAQVEK